MSCIDLALLYCVYDRLINCHYCSDILWCHITSPVHSGSETCPCVLSELSLLPTELEFSSKTP